MNDKFVSVATSFWVVAYIIIFKIMGIVFYYFLIFHLGVGLATFTYILTNGSWGSIFFNLLLREKSSEKARHILGRFLDNKNGNLFVRLREMIDDSIDSPNVPLFWLFVVFVLESPLSGVAIIRLTYSKESQGYFWIWLGSVANGLFWFLPIYGGGFSLLKLYLHL